MRFAPLYLEEGDDDDDKREKKRERRGRGRADVPEGGRGIRGPMETHGSPWQMDAEMIEIYAFCSRPVHSISKFDFVIFF